MLQLKLDMSMDVTSVDDGFEDSKRLRHRRMILRAKSDEISRDTKSKVMEIIKNSSVENLSLCWLPLSLQNAILSSLTNITFLYVDSLYVHPKYHSVIDFPNLKEVDCIRSDFILNSIGRHSIEKLRISYISPETVDFLKTCNALKDLSIWGFNAYFDYAFNNFQLKVLRLEASLYDVAYHHITWDIKSGGKFLESQRNSIRELHIPYCDVLFTCDELVIYALNNMNLKVLIAYYPIGIGKVNKLNEQMKELKIDFEDTPITENIIACCPNVEKIDLTFASQIFEKILPMVSKHMVNLKQMKLAINFPQDFGEIKARFDQLECLDVSLFNARDTDTLLKLIKCCPNLKFLKINMPSIFAWTSRQLNEFFVLIPNVIEIQSLGNFGLFDETMQLIIKSENTLKLKYLKIFVMYPERYEKLLYNYRHSKISFMALQYP